MPSWPRTCNAASSVSTAPDDRDAIVKECRSKPPHTTLFKPPRTVAFHRPYPAPVLVILNVRRPTAKKHGKSILHSCLGSSSLAIRSKMRILYTWKLDKSDD